MGLCGCVCRVFVCLLALPLLLICSVCIPQVELAYIRFVETYTLSVPPLHLLLTILGQVPRIWEHGPLGVGPVFNPRLVYAVDGYKTVPNPENFTRGYMLARVSHEKVRAVHHNPHLGRIGNALETNRKRTGNEFPTWFFQWSPWPATLHFQGDLLSAAMPSIAQDFDPPAFKPLPGISPEDLVHDISWHLKIPFPKVVSTMVQNIFAYTFFRTMPQDDVRFDELPLLREWLGAARSSQEQGGGCGGFGCEVFEDKVAASEWGKQFMEEAERRGPNWTAGMNGMDRLRKTVFEFSFAGFGGDGPGGDCIRFIQTSPEKYVPLFKKDPEAFVLEAISEEAIVIRMQGGGGAGMNPWVVEETQRLEPQRCLLGKAIHGVQGSYGATIAIHANHDPAVFGGPSADQQYAMTFVPGRENADRILSFVGELKEIRPNMTGCDAAPRFCLGTFMLLLGRHWFRV
eukprot:Skav229618  [mRNA]  locus=scaffold510:334146:349925:- [translate_table: standard]